MPNQLHFPLSLLKNLLLKGFVKNSNGFPQATIFASRNRCQLLFKTAVKREGAAYQPKSWSYGRFSAVWWAAVCSQVSILRALMKLPLHKHVLYTKGFVQAANVGCFSNRLLKGVWPSATHQCEVDISAESLQMFYISSPCAIDPQNDLVMYGRGLD